MDYPPPVITDEMIGAVITRVVSVHRHSTRSYQIAMELMEFRKAKAIADFQRLEELEAPLTNSLF